MSAALKGLTLWQPWASLLATGVKGIETRDWHTSYRGHVAIHASKACMIGVELSLDPITREAAAGAGFPHIADMPRGAILGVARLVACQPAETLTAQLSPRERALGDYRLYRYGWIFTDRRLLPTPIPCKGALALWDLEPDIEAQILAALSLPPPQPTLPLYEEDAASS